MYFVVCLLFFIPCSWSYSVSLNPNVTVAIFPRLVNTSTSSADPTFNAASEFLGACGREYFYIE